MRVLYVDAMAAPTAQSNTQGILKAYKELGHTVRTFDYRATAIRFGKDATWDAGSGSWSRRTTSALAKMNRLLVDTALAYRPQFVHLGKCEFVSGAAIKQIKQGTRAFVVHAYLDLSEEPKPWVADIGHYADYTVLATDEPRVVQSHLRAGCRRVGFWMPGVDPAIYRETTVDKIWDVIFMGNYIDSTGPERVALLNRLASMGLRVKVCGANWAHRLQKPMSVSRFVDGPAFAEVTSRARLALSYNRADHRMYASWRRILNSMACGTMVLCRYFPGLETVFTDRKHLAWFSDTEEATGLALHYVANDTERKSIARDGRQRVVTAFTWCNQVQALLDLRHAPVQ